MNDTPRLGGSVYPRGSDDPNAPPRRGGIVWRYRAEEILGPDDLDLSDRFAESIVCGHAAVYETITGTPKRLREHTIIQRDVDDTLTAPPNLRTISGMIRNLAEVIAWPGGQRRASPGPPRLALTDHERHLLEIAHTLSGCLPDH
jgi:hypothetical protein